MFPHMLPSPIHTIPIQNMNPAPRINSLRLLIHQPLPPGYLKGNDPLGTIANRARHLLPPSPPLPLSPSCVLKPAITTLFPFLQVYPKSSLNAKHKSWLFSAPFGPACCLCLVSRASFHSGHSTKPRHT